MGKVRFVVAGEQVIAGGLPVSHQDPIDGGKFPLPFTVVPPVSYDVERKNGSQKKGGE